MGMKPYTVSDTEIRAWKISPRFPFPNWSESGRETFRGYTRINTYFVDSSGFGSDSEPALTVEAFVNKLRPGCSYAIVGVGQFQVYIAEFSQITTRRGC